MNKIVIKIDYLEDGKLVANSAGAFMTDNLTMVQVREIAKETFVNNLSNVITDCLTK